LPAGRSLWGGLPRRIISKLRFLPECKGGGIAVINEVVLLPKGNSGMLFIRYADGDAILVTSAGIRQSVRLFVILGVFGLW